MPKEIRTNHWKAFLRRKTKAHQKNKDPLNGNKKRQEQESLTKNKSIILKENLEKQKWNNTQKKTPTNT